MVNLTYDSSVIQISEIQIKYISDVLEKQGFKDSKVTFEPIGKKGDNYVANVIRILVESDDGGTFKMVAKVAPVHEGFRKVMFLEELFRNESIMYLEILPKFLELQKNAGVAKNDQIKFAKCYGVLSEAPNEVILLEDLKESNFEMLNRFESMPDECMRLALKRLATVHSLTFVLKNKEPNTYELFINKLVNVWALMNSSEGGMRILFENLPGDLIPLLDNDKYKKIVGDVMSQYHKTIEKLIAYSANSKHSVILQGDCWNNNILFKMENGKPLEICMVDYQISMKGNPAGDFLYLTFNCSDYGNRRKYFTEWVDYYHKQLDESLENFGLKANFLYPRDQFDADLRRHGKLAMGLSFLACNTFVRDSEQSVDLKSNSNDYNNVAEQTIMALSISSLNEKSAMKFKNRVEELIDSFLEFGLY